MKKTDVLRYFNNRVTDVAKACGVTTPAVCQWGEVIPEKNALKLGRLTHGSLKYDPEMYVKTA